MPSITLKSGTVNYLDVGDGVPLLLLHANPGNIDDYSAVIPALSARFRVLAINWPGYGGHALNHPPETATVLSFYTILCEFIEAMALSPVLLMGNSLGGNVAARIAIEKPAMVRGLVLVSPGGFTAHNWLTRMFCRLQGSRFALSPYIWASWYLRIKTPTAVAMLQRASGDHASANSLVLNRAIWRSFASPENNLRTTAHKITAKTLLVFGQRDPAIPAHKDGRVAQQCLPQAGFVSMASGHAPFAEVPDAFLAAVMPFLAAC